MKRYHNEKHIIEARMREFKNIGGWIGWDFNAYLPVLGSFRKTRRAFSCGRVRCQVCHPEKYPKRIPTRQERQPWPEED